MERKRRIGTIGAAALVAAGLGCGTGTASSGGEGAERASAAATVDARAAAARTVTLRHRASGFTIRAPRGFRLAVEDGVYVLRKGAVTMSHSRTTSPAGAAELGDALLQRLGGQTRSRRASGTQFTAQVARGAFRETVVVRKAGDTVAVTTASAPARRALSLATVRRTAASARGGFVFRPPAGAEQPATAELPLVPYRTPDGGATALVPQGWQVDGGNGLLQGNGDQGGFLLGYFSTPFLPETAPPGTPQNILVAPYQSAADALVNVFPMLSPAVRNVRIRKLVADAPLPSFSSSGMFAYNYELNGQPWTGVATVATDSPDRYSNYTWGFYFSGIGVAAGSDGSVGSALVKVWNSWDPSGAIAQRTQRAKELIAETAAVWQEVGEFRRATSDRQARDVGCLLQGYYAIEDNSRRYDLPPLPCGQQYVPR